MSSRHVYPDDRSVSFDLSGAQHLIQCGDSAKMEVMPHRIATRTIRGGGSSNEAIADKFIAIPLRSARSDKLIAFKIDHNTANFKEVIVIPSDGYSFFIRHGMRLRGITNQSPRLDIYYIVLP